MEDGGAVLVAAGPEYADNVSIYRTPLASVLPAAPTGASIETPYRADVPDATHRHPRRFYTSDAAAVLPSVPRARSPPHLALTT